jgi:hypothetical protein
MYHIKPITILILIGLPQQDQSLESKCHICGKQGNLGLKAPNGFIKDQDATCAQIAVQVYKELVNCKEKQDQNAICCNGSQIQTKPPSPPATLSPIKRVGRYPVCNLCQSKEFPKDPHHVINMLYIGPGTCEQYWKAGLEGNIPTHLCDPLRFFADSPCACNSKTADIDIKSNHHTTSNSKRSIEQQSKARLIFKTTVIAITVCATTILAIWIIT